MDKLILILILLSFYQRIFSQNDTIISVQSIDGQYIVENYYDNLTEKCDSIIFKEKKIDNKISIYTFEAIERNDCEKILNNLATECIVLQIPIVNSIIYFNDTTIILTGIKYNSPIVVQHLIVINTINFEIIKRIAFVGIRSVGDNNLSFMIIGKQLYIPKLLNKIANDYIYLIDNSTGEIKRISFEKTIFYYDKGKALLHSDSIKNYFREECRNNDMFKSDIFIIDIW
ncbi:MAG: hypothetical protein RBR32_12195 [Bacteroidales bacterium]|nr:hypothetical protein [Bacteroidales bacterium]